MRARLVLVLALGLACAGVRDAQAQDAAPVPGASPVAAAPFAGVVLEDPDERPWDLGRLAGHPALVVVADRSASGASVEWGRGIGAARPQGVSAWLAPGKVAVVSVADLRAVPGFARGTARWIIAVMVGEQGAGGPPLLLDWDGAVATRIGARAGVPNVRLYAADGTLVLRDEGDATPERIARLAAAIDGLVPPPAAAADADDAPTPAAGNAP